MKKEILEKILKEYKEGSSLRKLRDKYNYSIGNLHYHLKKEGILRTCNIVKKIKTKNESLIGIFVGLFAGDGSKFKDRWKYVVKISLHKEDSALIQFIQKLSFEIFGKTFRVVLDKKTNKGNLIMESLFIFNFLDKYLFHKGYKTLTVRLKEDIQNYSFNFLKGFLCGLTLSDGYAKKRFVLPSISKGLVVNALEILKEMGFEAKMRFQDRQKYHENDQYKATLRTKETKTFKEVLNRFIEECGFKETIDSLKRYNSQAL